MTDADLRAFVNKCCCSPFDAVTIDVVSMLDVAVGDVAFVDVAVGTINVDDVAVSNIDVGAFSLLGVVFNREFELLELVLLMWICNAVVLGAELLL